MSHCFPRSEYRCGVETCKWSSLLDPNKSWVLGKANGICCTETKPLSQGCRESPSNKGSLKLLKLQVKELKRKVTKYVLRDRKGRIKNMILTKEHYTGIKIKYNF